MSTLEVLQSSISIENTLIRINPMVFGRLTTLIKHKYEKVQQFICELTPEPTSLFTDEYMRKQNKSILCNHILEVSTYESTSPAAGTCVAIGGNLLHNIPWALPCTYSDILDQCHTQSNIHLKTTANVAESSSSLTDMKMRAQRNTKSILTGLRRE